MKNRKTLNETINNMFISDKYKKSTLFYAHLLAQTKIILDENLPAPAGVTFELDHYNMYINETLFSEYNLNDRMFILIHEMLHILMNHLTLRSKLGVEKVNHEISNIAMDCAINQIIPNLKIPDSAIIPNNLPIKDTSSVRLMADSEYYYKILKNEFNEQNDQNDSDNSDGSDGSDGSDNLKNAGKKGKIDTHETWANSNNTEFSEELMKDVTSRMIEQSINETQKQRGDLPSNIEHIMNLFSNKSQVNWKKVLKNITGNKKIGKRPTIMKKSRRFPKRPDLKGIVKDRTFELVCIADISGSMNDKEILVGLNEISSICKTNNTTMKLLQVDSQVKKNSLEIFTSKTRLFERKGSGGTYIASGVEFIHNEKIHYDALIVITDGYIENISTDKHWAKVKTRVMWLTTNDTTVPGIEKMPKHKAYPLKI